MQFHRRSTDIQKKVCKIHNYDSNSSIFSFTVPKNSLHVFWHFAIVVCRQLPISGGHSYCWLVKVWNRTVQRPVPNIVCDPACNALKSLGFRLYFPFESCSFGKWGWGGWRFQNGIPLYHLTYWYASYNYDGSPKIKMWNILPVKVFFVVAFWTLVCHSLGSFKLPYQSDTLW